MKNLFLSVNILRPILILLLETNTLSRPLSTITTKYKQLTKNTLNVRYMDKNIVKILQVQVFFNLW